MHLADFGCITFCRAPTLRLSRKELQQQLRLIKEDGLLGRGATAYVFKCVWPDRFGPSTLLAAKVTRNEVLAHLGAFTLIESMRKQWCSEISS
jgi:hypothetical protein